MNRNLGNHIIIGKGFSSFSDQDRTDLAAKMAKADSLRNQILVAKQNLSQKQGELQALKNRKEVTLGLVVPYCNIHPAVCRQARQAVTDYQQTYDNLVSALIPQINQLNADIKNLQSLQLADANSALADSNLSPAERQELERKKRELEASIALQTQKQKDLVTMTRGRNQKIIIISIISVIGLATVIYIIYRARKAKKAA